MIQKYNFNFALICLQTSGAIHYLVLTLPALIIGSLLYHNSDLRRAVWEVIATKLISQFNIKFLSEKITVPSGRNRSELISPKNLQQWSHLERIFGTEYFSLYFSP